MVEDDPASRKALGKLLSHRGLEVTSAATLAEAAALIGDDTKFLVLDLMLPDGDGLTLLRNIRTAGRPIRVAVTTGTIDRPRIEAARLLKPDVLLFKPIALEDLLRGLGIDD